MPSTGIGQVRKEQAVMHQCANPPAGRKNDEGEEVVLGELSLPNKAASAKTARDFVRNTLEAWSLGDVEIARLAVTELAANAWKHASAAADSAIRILVIRSDSHTRIEVHDPSPRLPRIENAAELEESGRGLLLLSELVEDWGSFPTPSGKAVWFATRR
jgi:anti-sigma regulatory factor (Ser/Thr protein kinase)